MWSARRRTGTVLLPLRRPGTPLLAYPREGGKVDKEVLTRFGRAMKQLGIEMIPECSPEARGRYERVFRTHQDRLPKELALHGPRKLARYDSGGILVNQRVKATV